MNCRMDCRMNCRMNCRTHKELGMGRFEGWRRWSLAVWMGALALLVAGCGGGVAEEEQLAACQTTTADGCASHPAGDWAACQKGGLTDKTLCGFDEGASAGTVTCLSPSSGSFNVCGIRDCVENCDCFAAPTSGDAIPSCEMVGGSKACVLYCLNGQQCPDAMECVGGYCYWPD